MAGRPNIQPTFQPDVFFCVISNTLHACEAIFQKSDEISNKIEHSRRRQSERSGQKKMSVEGRLVHNTSGAAHALFDEEELCAIPCRIMTMSDGQSDEGSESGICKDQPIS